MTDFTVQDNIFERKKDIISGSIFMKPAAAAKAQSQRKSYHGRSRESKLSELNNFDFILPIQ